MYYLSIFFFFFFFNDTATTDIYTLSLHDALPICIESNTQYICIEGCDGFGKSSLTQMLSDYLKNKGKKVVQTKEPGTPLRSEEHTSELQSHVNLVCRLLLEKKKKKKKKK